MISRPLFIRRNMEIVMKRDKNYILGIIALFLAALTWGSAFIFMKSGVEAFSPEWLLGLRFGMAGILLNLICFKKWKEVNRKILKHGIWMGIILYFEFYFFALGIQYTTASKSSFIVAAYIAFVPAAYWVIRRKRPEGRDIVAAFVCLAGTAFILFDGTGGVVNKGDLLTLFCTVFYAVHVVYGGVYAREESPLLLNMIQIGTSGIIALAAALLTGPIPVDADAGSLWGVVYLAVVSTIIPYLLSLYGQAHVRTATSAVILSFESVFGCLTSVLILKEQISLRFVLGALIIMTAFFISEGLVGGRKKIQSIS